LRQSNALLSISISEISPSMIAEESPALLSSVYRYKYDEIPIRLYSAFAHSALDLELPVHAKQ
jgi:hypothetical protein